MPIRHFFSNQSIQYRHEMFGQTILYRKCEQCRGTENKEQIDMKVDDKDIISESDSDDDYDEKFHKCVECNRLDRTVHEHITQRVVMESYDEEMVHKYCHGVVEPYHLPERARLKKAPPAELCYETIHVFHQSKCFGCQQYQPIANFLKTREVIYQNLVYPHPRIFRTCDYCRQESRNEYICNPIRKLMEPITEEDRLEKEEEEEEDSES